MSRPDEWSEASIADLCLVNPKPSKREPLEGSAEVTFVPMAAVDEKTGAIEAPQVRRYQDVARGYTSFAEGDLLFAKVTPCMENGKVAIAKGLKNNIGFGSTEFHVLRPRSELLPGYLYHFLRQPWFRKQAALSFVGSGGLQRVPADFFARAKIPLPPLDEQREIVSLLDEISSVAGLLGDRDDAVRQVLDRSLDAVLASQPPSIWQELGAFVETKYGTSTRSDADGQSGRPVLRIPNVLGGEVDLRNLKHVNLSSEEVRRLSLEEGDVLLVRSNGNPDYVGRSAAITPDVGGGKFVYASYLIRLRPDQDRLLGSFLAAMLNSRHGRESMQNAIRTTAGQSNLSAESLSRLKFPIPPLDVQLKFDAAWREYIDLRKLCRESSAAQEMLFEELSAKALAGELTRSWRAQHAPKPADAFDVVPPPVAAAEERAEASSKQERDTTFSRPRRAALISALSSLQTRVWDSLRHEWRGAVVVGDPKAFSEFCDHDRVTWRLQGLDPSPAEVARTLDQLASMGLIRKMSLPSVRAGTEDVEFVTAFRPLRRDEELERAEDETALDDARSLREGIARKEGGGR
jgi:type I restriction enzyme, S subunit